VAISYGIIGSLEETNAEKIETSRIIKASGGQSFWKLDPTSNLAWARILGRWNMGFCGDYRSKAWPSPILM